jgi:exosome complex RNA-binding protein Rrp42 (RNase PH superfamily)
MKADHVRVIARISVEVTTPLPERKFDGVFQIFTEFSPMASPAFEIGRYVMRDLEAFDDL